MNHTLKYKLFGLLFLAVGVGYLGEQMNLWSFSIFFPGWWTLFLIIPAFFSMLENGIHVGNGLVLLFGGYYLLYANDFIDIRLTWGLIFALGCILCGIKLVFMGDGKREYKSRQHYRETKADDGKDIKSSVIFGEKRFRITGRVETLVAESVCGSQRIDLSKADLRDVRMLHLDCVCGNIDLIVSDEIEYVVKRDNLFGSVRVDDSYHGTQKLLVDTNCVLGSIHLHKIHIEQPFQEGQFKEKR